MQIGNYLGKAVRLEDLASDKKLPSDVNGATVLIHSTVLGRVNIERLIRRLVNQGALAIWVSGGRADQYFDWMLEIISSIQSQAETITGIIKSSDFSSSVIDFLITAIPSVERFNEWSSYLILCDSSEAQDGLKDVRNYLANRSS